MQRWPRLSDAHNKSRLVCLIQSYRNASETQIGEKVHAIYDIKMSVHSAPQLACRWVRVPMLT